jgi:outer membrane protein assembly factor BamB
VFTASVPCGRDLLVVPSCDSRVFAVNRRTGKPAWKFTGAWGAYHSSPVVRRGSVYAGNDDGRLYAIDARTGALRWSVNARSPVWTRPLLLPDRVVFGTLGGWLCAASLKGGRLLWRRKLGRRIYLSDPVLHRGKILVGTTDGALRAVTPEGDKLWTRRTGGALAGGPAVVRDTAYFVTKGGLCTALDLGKRKPLWTRRLRGGTIYAPGVAGNRLFVGTGAGITYALDRSSGEVLWRFHSPGRTGVCHPSGGTVFVFSWNGRAYALNPATGELRWSLRTLGDLRGFPRIHDGWLYIGSLDFALYAVQLP